MNYDREVIISESLKDWDELAHYRYLTLREISSQLKVEFGVSFDVDHVHTLKEGGKHHPNNMQLLTSTDNRSKNSGSTKRMNIKKQTHYIKTAILNKALVTGTRISSKKLDTFMVKLESIYTKKNAQNLNLNDDQLNERNEKMKTALIIVATGGVGYGAYKAVQFAYSKIKS